MNHNTKISKCPFCGSIAKVIEIDVLINKQKKVSDIFYKVTCIHAHCNATTKEWYPKEAAISAWNFRNAVGVIEILRLHHKYRLAEEPHYKDSGLFVATEEVLRKQ